MTRVQHIIENIRSINPKLVDELYEELKRQRHEEEEKAAKSIDEGK